MVKMLAEERMCYMHLVMNLSVCWMMLQEELSAYELLVSSLQPLKRARVEGEESGKKGEESVRREEEKEEEAELTVVDSGEEESDSDGEAAASTGRGGWGWPVSVAAAKCKLTVECHSLADPFSVHVECDLTEEEVRDLKVTLSQPLHYQHTAVSAGSHERNHRTNFRLVLPPSLPHTSSSILCWALSVVLSVSLPETVASPVTSSL